MDDIDWGDVFEKVEKEKAATTTPMEGLPFPGFGALGEGGEGDMTNPFQGLPGELDDIKEKRRKTQDFGPENRDFEDLRLAELTMKALEAFRTKVKDEARMETVFQAKNNFTQKFDNRAYLPPHGMTDFDYKCIPQHRREGFEKFKHRARHENYKYLGEHRELDAMINLFFKSLFKEQPEDPVVFAAEYFTRDTQHPQYETMLEKEARKISNYRVAKMRAAQKITTTVLHETDKSAQEKHWTRCPTLRKPVIKRCQEDEEDEFLPPEKQRDENLNLLKKLNIGPLALDFDTKPKLKPKSKKSLAREQEEAEVKKEEEPEPVPHRYCGCKDPGVRKPTSPPQENDSEPKRQSLLPHEEDPEHRRPSLSPQDDHDHDHDHHHHERHRPSLSPQEDHDHHERKRPSMSPQQNPEQKRPSLPPQQDTEPKRPSLPPQGGDPSQMQDKDKDATATVPLKK